MPWLVGGLRGTLRIMTYEFRRSDDRGVFGTCIAEDIP